MRNLFVPELNTCSKFSATECSYSKEMKLKLFQALEEQGVSCSEKNPLNWKKKWPAPLGWKKGTFTRQPNSVYDMLGSKFQHPYLKRVQMKKAIEDRNKQYATDSN